MKLPVESAKSELIERLSEHPLVLLQAPPGAGKTTRVPIWLEQLGKGKILLLEPRRLAVLNAAKQLASGYHEEPGQTVGYKMRFDSKTSGNTRILAVTEGTFIRMIQADPELSGFDYVILDEFHERHLDTDLALTLLRSSQLYFRTDLKLVLMSATLGGDSLAKRLDAPLVESQGFMHPVTTHFQHKTSHNWIEDTPALVNRAIEETTSNILLIAPGIRDIRRLSELLIPKFPELEVIQLHGSSTWQEQKLALSHPENKRRLTISSPVTESSVTLPQITSVIDSGKARFPEYDRKSGLTRLVTKTISRASADQRRGRAGRESAGTCYRLWTSEQDQRLVEHSPPEIVSGNYLSLALELALWGEADEELPWLDQPNPVDLAKSRDLLQQLGALKQDFSITDAGRKILSMGMEPRLSHMLHSCSENPELGDCRRLAVLIQENQLPTGMLDSDSINSVKLNSAANQLQQQLSARFPALANQKHSHMGLQLTQAFPDRIGLLSGDSYKFVSGIRAKLDFHKKPNWLVAANLYEKNGSTFVGSWAALDWPEPSKLTGEHLKILPDALQIHSKKITHIKDQELRAIESRMLGEIELQQQPYSIRDDEMASLWASWLTEQDMEKLVSEKEAKLLRRLSLAEKFYPDHFKPVNNESLQARLEYWLQPFLNGVKKLSQIPFKDALLSELDYQSQTLLDQQFPVTLEINKRKRDLDYLSDGSVVLAIKLQEMFGTQQSPSLADGMLPVTMHLLSPAGRPLQVTQDLSHFWQHGYQEVKKEMKGRYPKHPWPDDPVLASPSSGTKKQNKRLEQ